MKGRRAEGVVGLWGVEIGMLWIGSCMLDVCHRSQSWMSGMSGDSDGGKGHPSRVRARGGWLVCSLPSYLR